MQEPRYRIIGHRLCPYVQRVVITMQELGLPYDREDIDLDDKPPWLEDLSPNRQVPVFRVPEGDWLFESGVITRYLDRTAGGGLLPADPLTAARHEAWMSHADGMLSIVARIIYRDADEKAVARSMSELIGLLKRMEARFAPDPYFAGTRFGLVDIVMATLFRYFPVLEMVSPVRIGPELGGRLEAWWSAVRARASVSSAVPPNYHTELIAFIADKPSHAGRRLSRVAPRTARAV